MTTFSELYWKLTTLEHCSPSQNNLGCRKRQKYQQPSQDQGSPYDLNDQQKERRFKKAGHTLKPPLHGQNIMMTVW